MTNLIKLCIVIAVIIILMILIKLCSFWLTLATFVGFIVGCGVSYWWFVKAIETSPVKDE